MPDETPPEQKIAAKLVQRPIETEMKKSYIDYAMSVIVGRALPDVSDGLGWRGRHQSHRLCPDRSD